MQTNGATGLPKNTCCRQKTNVISDQLKAVHSNLHTSRHLGVRGRSGDATLAGINGHVATDTPAGTPAVLHLDGVAIIADGGHTVIEVAATTGSDDTTSVLLEHRLVCLDGDGHRLAVQCALEGRCAAGDVSVTSDSAGWDGGAVAALAGAITGSVRIAALSGHCLVLGEGESVIHQTTVAAAVLLAAIDEELLRHAGERTGSQFPCTLETASGGECPARSALALVLDWGHCTLGGPVHCSDKLFRGVLTKLGQAKVGSLRETTDGQLLELFEGQVREHSGTQSGTALVLTPHFLVGLEDRLALRIFAITVVHLSKVLLVLFPVHGGSHGEEHCELGHGWKRRHCKDWQRTE